MERRDRLKGLTGVASKMSEPSSSTFVKHQTSMVEPDFDVGKMHPNDEPFWLVASPYADPSDNPFLLDRGGMYALIEQCQKALADYYATFPFSLEEVDVDQMRPGRSKARPPLKSPYIAP